ncbi:TRAP transporter substrate-binding protein [Ammoniphilus resinae]|uniref:Tripartite ATP-independent transporter DctP family solute receptor n=1 Tax=Ammoniphilus resinae TaxID=861532 RepID=A0ABS4GPJ5_9BACL|nr:TRAP transporter substrate-binding protein [Ammoniphilus resinae]MBP1932184.1 tripartite ATP-independent transporter DctP family solute receptor [Ammoniphilus resinae]
MRKFMSSVLVTLVATSGLLVGCGGGESSSGGKESAAPANASAPADQKSESKPAEVIELNLGHTLTADSERQIIAEKMAQLAEEKSGGTIKISTFPQSQLGGEVKQIQSVRTGAQGMLIVSTAALENTYPEYSIFDLPYLFDSAEQANKVFQSEVGDKFLDMLSDQGLVGLGWGWANERNIFASKKVETPEDVKGLKTRVMQAPGYVKTYETLGAQPTPMAYGEVYLAVQQGTVDGGDTSPDQFVMDKFLEVAKYYNKTKLHYVPIVTAISKSKWDQMTPDQQKALQEAVDEALAFGVEYNKTYYDKYYEEMKKAGVEIVESDVEAFKKAAMPARESILKEIPNGEELLKEIEAAK